MVYRDEKEQELTLAQSHTYEFVAGLHVGQTIVERVMASDDILPAGRIFDYIVGISMDSPERKIAVMEDAILKRNLYRSNDQAPRDAFNTGEMLGIHDQLCRLLGSEYESVPPTETTPPVTELSAFRSKNKS